eukprot:TRINITY_DN28431_c0_g1_i1.p1 TRINITY_DN28431_c0_g1~~TRINITY_DN28431_c0_g1_i1.p1  ORF type:complete len:537 (+),score=107.40 TRINITY_DN28431_c0_g1_i1:71-1612(+)
MAEGGGGDETAPGGQERPKLSRKYTFATREHWEDMQALLHKTAEIVAEKGEDHGQEATEVDYALEAYDEITTKILLELKEHAKKPKVEGFLEETYVRPAIEGCIFVGHLATDLDSIAGAIGAAELYGGVACKSEAVLNGEIKYALTEVAKLPEPPLFDETPGGGIPDAGGKLSRVCLVDHNDESQMVKSLRSSRERIVGCIDHHAVSSTFSSKGPMFLEFRPWGSMSSIIAHLYVRSNAWMKPEVARLLMCAILSDTLNLQSVTTTNADRFAVCLLAKIGCVENPDQTARLMFRAKTNWIAGLGPYAMVRGDQKDFKWDDWRVGIAVLEVTDMEPVLAHADELLLELRFLKKEKGGAAHRIRKDRAPGTLDAPHANELDFAYLFIVDIVQQCSVLLICGGREYALAEKAFPGCPYRCAKEGLKAPGQTIEKDHTLCDVGPLVSRKAQFAPALSAVLEAGFTCHKERVCSSGYQPSKECKAVAALLESGASVVLDDNQQFRRQTTPEDCLALAA